MIELDNLAVQGTPLAADLRGAAPGLTTLSRNLPAFNRSATTGLQALGRASVTGRSALRKGRDEIKQLGKSAKKSFATADDLTKFLRDIDDPNRAVEVDARAARDSGRKAPTGYTGMEGLLNYVYYQTLRDQPVRRGRPPAPLLDLRGRARLRARNTTRACTTARSASRTPTARPRPPTSARRTAASPGSATTSPASTSTLEPAALRPLRLPGGLDRHELCDPAGTLTGGARVRSSGSAGGDGTAPAGGAPGSESGGDSGTVPDAPDAPGTPDVRRRPRRRRPAAARPTRRGRQRAS